MARDKDCNVFGVFLIYTRAAGLGARCRRRDPGGWTSAFATNNKAAALNVTTQSDRKETMIATRHMSVLVLGACLLGLSVPGSQKHPVARPFQGYAEGSGVLSVDESGVVVYEGYAEGNFTHLGRTTLHAQGYMNEAGILVAEVTMTAANGDQLIYASDSGPGSPIPFVGGTGRFADATGSHTEAVEATFSPGPDGTTVIVFSAYYDGTLIY